MTEQNNTSKTLLHSFLIITHALELQPNSNPYRELKHRMNPEELIVLQHMQKQISAKKHQANKKEGQVPSNNRGRRRKPKGEEAVAVSDVAEHDNTVENITETCDTELPPSFPS